MGHKIIIIGLLLLILILPVTLFAEQGIGIVLGEPTGLSYKSDNLAVGLGWSFASPDSRIDATIDWWLINEALTTAINWYLGVGAKVGLKLNKDKDTFNVGLRIPIGLQFWATEELELFAELAPGILLIPGTEADFSGGIGLRYYF